MTDVLVLTAKGDKDTEDIVGVSVTGHANYGESGKDIVCSSVSTTMAILESGVRDELNIPCLIRSDSKKGIWEVTWEKTFARKAAPFARVITGFLFKLSIQYPNNVHYEEEMA